MKHERIHIEPESGIKCNLVDVFYCCPHCGAELISYSRDFFDICEEVLEFVKEDLRCPVCGAPISQVPIGHDQTDGEFLNLSIRKHIFDAATLLNAGPVCNYSRNVKTGERVASPNRDLISGNSYYFNKKECRIELHDDDDEVLYSPNKELDENYIELPSSGVLLTDSKELDLIFDCLKQIRLKKEEDKHKAVLNQLISEAEAQQIEMPKVDVGQIKSDPNALNTYIEHLINLESSIFSCERRIFELQGIQFAVDEDVRYEANANGIDERIILEKAKKQLADIQSGKIKAPPIQRPKKPKEPEKPTIKQAGFFNKKKIQAENEAAQASYNKSYSEYEIALAKYNEALKGQKKKKEEWIKSEKERAEKEYTQAQKALERIISNPPPSVEMERKKLVDTEISEAEETLKKLIKAKNELYSVNIVFGKYRNFVAMSSFYEYLLSGRCISLEGPNGAYNIYETEIRANQIISQLSEVLNSLDQIKENQFTAFSKLQSMNVELLRLNTSMMTALDSIGKTQADVSAIAKNSDVISYNMEQSAYYAKKNAELTNALGFMVALK